MLADQADVHFSGLMAMDLKSYKNQYLFRLSAPSYIFPCDWAENVRRLSPFLDEIELIFFESAAQSLPTPSQIQELIQIARSRKITYNVHLPLDIDLGASCRQQRKKAVEKLYGILTHLTALEATAFTLHLNYSGDDRARTAPDLWRAYTAESLGLILEKTNPDVHRFTIETLDYSPFWLIPFLEQFPLTLCLDIGHVVLYKHNLLKVIETLGDRTTMVHLHGVANGRDHLALNEMSSENLRIIKHFLKNFQGGVSLEVFSFERLKASLECLATLFEPNKHYPI
ncbi:MAG: sugar phosphate isomerase/epimerase [Desulfobacteraceae bacterium]|nr:sugar phosphate isomerase/epimerase [Desulfobacteraceae bacterium]